MVDALQHARQYVAANTPIVFVGETGTGKSFLAEQLHNMSPRAGQPFIDFTAAEIPDSLIQSLLFGHEAGAFSGASGRHAGYFEQAGRGSLLCDDAHLLPKSAQAALLRTLSRGVFRTLAGKRDIPFQCRLMFGLRECPDTLMHRDVLLPDFRYRLGYCIVPIAPLRERRDEIASLARQFLLACEADTGVAGPTSIAPDTLPALEAAPWPGNVRELRAVIQAAYLHAQGDSMVRFDHLPEVVRIAPRFRACGDPAHNERAMTWALWRTNGRVEEAAALIGAHRNTVSKFKATAAVTATAHNPAASIVHNEYRSATSA